MRSAVTISLVPEARGGPFVFWDDLDVGCARAAALGFDGIEMFPPDAATVRAAGLPRRLRDNNLRLAAVGTGAGWLKHKLRLTDPDAGVRQRAREFIGDIIDAAGELGAPAIIGSMQGRWGDGVSREQALEWLGEALAGLGPRAMSHGVPLLYEPLNRYETNLLNRLGDAVDFLHHRRLTSVRLLADLFHMNLEEADLGEAFRQAAAWVGHVHFADSNRQAVGLGHTGMRPVIAALREIGYAGYLSAEVLPLPDSETAAARTIESFRALAGTGSTAG